MRDAMNWSIPLGRMFGIQVPVHILFPIMALGMIGQVAAKDRFPAGTWMDALMLAGLFFISILLHEFGHCFGARWVDGDASEILMWPLGGLAYCDVPHTPRANFICTICGPLVNVVLCLASGVLIALSEPTLRPTWNPFWYPYRVAASGQILLYTWSGTEFLTTQP